MPMNLNQPTLHDFEEQRSDYNYSPPKGSDTFYTVGSGQIDLLTSDTFELSIIDGRVDCGRTFTVSESLYSLLYVCSDTKIDITRELVVTDNGMVDVYGDMNITSASSLKVSNASSVILHLNSSVVIEPYTAIAVDDTSSLQIFGNIYCHHTCVNKLYSDPNIYIDNSATLYVTGLEDLGDRPHSLTEYTVDLRSDQLTPHSQGEYDTPEGKLGFNTADVDYDDEYQLLDLFVMRGSSILGDFKYSVLGSPKENPSSTQLVRSVTVGESCTLVVSSSYNGFSYINPTLYVGPIINNSIEAGTVTINGDLLVDGADSSVVLDRGGSLTVSSTGTVTLNNSAVLEVSNTIDPVFTLNGTLVLHSLDQLKGFSPDNIVIGDTGTIIVLNDECPDDTVLFSTPNGIHDTYFHYLFHNRIKHLQYHIPHTCGIRIDESMDEYRTMSNWYAGMRLEEAIGAGLLIWNDSFIELDTTTVPWAADLTNLYDIPKLFNTYPAISKQERLQNLVDYLSKTEELTSIVFRITTNGKLIRTLTLNLRYPRLTHVSYSSVEDTFTVDATNPGKLFMRNKITYIKKANILSKQADMYPITTKDKRTNAKIHISGQKER